MQISMVNPNLIILITGSRKGIGYQMVQYYLDKGCTVIGCSRSESTINNLKYKHYKYGLRQYQSS